MYQLRIGAFAQPSDTNTQQLSMAISTFIRRIIIGKIGTYHRFFRRTTIQHVDQRIVPARLEAHMAIDLQYIFLTIPEFLGLSARPVGAMTVLVMHLLDAHLIRPVSLYHAVFVFFRIRLL